MYHCIDINYEHGGKGKGGDGLLTSLFQEASTASADNRFLKCSSSKNSDSQILGSPVAGKARGLLTRSRPRAKASPTGRLWLDSSRADERRGWQSGDLSV